VNTAINILILAAVFHGIPVASQSIHLYIFNHALASLFTSLIYF